MNQDKLVIGIGGVATSGKDTLCNLLIQALYLKGVAAKRRALADELKLDLRDSLLERYNIDVLNCSPQEKEIIRPDLVAYGRAKRLESLGTYWTSIVRQKMEQDEQEVIIVPDIRYHEHAYPDDEVPWVKKNGLLLHVCRYEENGGERVYIPPPNEDEATHDPRVRAAADFSLTWPSIPLVELQQTFRGFLETVSLIAIHELDNLERRATY